MGEDLRSGQSGCSRLVIGGMWCGKARQTDTDTDTQSPAGLPGSEPITIRIRKLQAMELISFVHRGESSFGKLVHNEVVDFRGVFQKNYGDMLSFLDGATQEDWSCAIAATRPLCDRDDVALLTPVPNARKIFGVGVNFESHARDTGRAIGDEPVLFIRLHDSQVGEGQTIRRSVDVRRFECEGELAVVIGLGGRCIAREHALAHVLGYSCFMDGSARDWQQRAGASVGKNFFASGGFGPWISTRQATLDVGALRIETFINGTLVQRGNTAEMKFSVADLIAYISRITPLLPGDVIVTGTPGKASADTSLELSPGDTVSVSIEGVGVLTNPVGEEP